MSTFAERYDEAVALKFPDTPEGRVGRFIVFWNLYYQPPSAILRV